MKIVRNVELNNASERDGTLFVGLNIFQRCFEIFFLFINGFNRIREVRNLLNGWTSDIRNDSKPLKIFKQRKKFKIWSVLQNNSNNLK